MLSYRIFLSVLVLVGTVVCAGLLLAAPLAPQWGERHTGDIKKGTLVLAPDQIIEQTFTLEYPHPDIVALWLDKTQPWPGVGGLQLDLRGSGATPTARVAFADVPPSGIAIFRFAQPLADRANTVDTIRLSSYQTKQTVHFMYQKDSSKYRGGGLVNQRGDLAFQIRYQRSALHSLTLQAAYSLGLVLAGLVMAYYIYRSPRTIIKLTAVRRQEIGLALLLGVLVTLFYGVSLLRPYWWLAPGDFIKDVGYLTASLDALRHLQWPGWSHLTCGGMPLLGNPESNSLSAGIILALFLPPERALLLLLAIEGGVAAMGMYFLARAMRVSRLGSILAAVIAVLSTAYGYRILEGFTMVGGTIAFLPWVFLGFLQASRKDSVFWVLVSGMSLVLMWFRGEVHIVAGIVITLGFISAYVAGQKRSWKPLWVLVVIGAVVFWGGSVKLLPYLEHADFFVRNLSPYTVRIVQDGLLDDTFLFQRDSSFKIPVRHGNFAEDWGNFGAYLGVAPLLLAGFGLLKKQPDRGWLITGLVVSAILCEGTLFDVVLRHWEIWGALLRMPIRLISIFILFVGLLAGHGLDLIGSFIKRVTFRRAITTAILLFVTWDLSFATAVILLDSTWMRTRAHLPLVSMPLLVPQRNFSPHDALYAGTLLRAGYLLPQLCADFNDVRPFVADKKTAFPLADVSSAVYPNRIRLTSITGPADLQVNENFEDDWVASLPGTVIEGDDGAMQVVVPAGQLNSLELTYTNPLLATEEALLILLVLVNIMILGTSFTFLA